MTTVKPKIDALDFDGIKNSIISYVKSKPEFSDYDFTGSAINNFIDILAYNTLYYGFYSNMIANEGFLDTAKLESSVVSLAKPLGIVVPGKKSSKAQYSLLNGSGSNINIVGYQTAFSGLINGVNYNFYTIESKTITPGSTELVTFYEGKSVISDLELNVDTATQTAFLGTTEIDIETIQVKVVNAEYPAGKIWTKKSSIDTNIEENSEIYFIERTASGFILIFGKKTINDFAEITIGKDITSQDTVYVSYLTSTGVGANGVSTIIVTPLTTVTSETTYGGMDGPDLDLIKTFAPKFFASNDRAVTKDDYYGILFYNNMINSANEVNVWGGEDAEPIAYGRVFISLIDGLSEQDPRVKEILSLLQSKSVITVIPEYVIPVELVLNTAFVVRLDKTYGTNTTNLTSNIRSVMAENYTPGFNFNFNSNDVNGLVKNITNAVIQCSIDSANTNIKGFLKYSVSDKIVYFKNEFYPSTTIGGAFNSDPIPTSLSGFDIILSDFPLEFVNGEPTVGKIIGRYNDGNLNQTSSSFGYDIDDLGYVDYKSGIVIIYESFLSKIRNTSNTYGIYVIPRYPNQIISKNEVLMSLNITGISYT